LGNLVNEMAKHASSGAIFVIVDRKESKVVEWANQLLNAAGLGVVGFHESSSNMDGDEQKDVMAQYEKVINRAPRVTWNGAFCLVGVKP
jgi:hypothetical protein